MRFSSVTDLLELIAAGCERAQDPTRAIMFVDDDDPGLMCMAVDGSIDDQAKVDQAFGGEHSCAGMATMTSWSPDADTPFSESWLVVAVRRDEPALFAVAPITSWEWYTIDVTDAPWLALSIAGSLRKALDGEPLTFRESSDRRLFNKLGLGEPPPMRPDGKI